MSSSGKTLKYTAAALAIAALIIVSSTLYLNQGSSSLGQAGAGSASLSIRLTDPPVVPKGTSSLNLTFSSIGLLVGEPAGSGQQTTKTVTVTPSGGSATLDLLKLQNVSQTIASASLPAGSTVYSFSFAVTSISIDVNGVKSPVTLATGGSTLTITLARPSTLQGSNVALLQLNPVIVSTPSGYQMIPSAVGIVRSESGGDKNEHEGSQHQLSNEDKDELDQAKGSVTATLSALSVSGNSTTITVEVKNTGNSSIVIRAIGVHGNFTAKGFVCHAGNDDSESKTHTTTTSTTTTTTTSTRHTETECEMKHAGVIVFVPVDTSVTGTSCVSSKMQLANGDSLEHEGHGLTLTKGQCVDLTFTGPISFGDSKLVLVPSTASGQVFGIHIVASEGANLSLSCKLPVTSTSCSVVHQQKDQ
jgi:hypothetical protein